MKDASGDEFTSGIGASADLRRAVAFGFEAKGKDFAIEPPSGTPVEFAQGVLAFLADRLKVQLRDSGKRHDLVDAVFALGDDDLVRIVARVEALDAFLKTEDGANLLAGPSARRTSSPPRRRRANGALDEAAATSMPPSSSNPPRRRSTTRWKKRSPPRARRWRRKTSPPP